MDRIDKLKEFLKGMPHDPFLLYALATEYKSLGDNAKALDYYTQVYNQHPEYLGNYYHYAIMLTKLGDALKAETVFKEGIKLATDQKNQHALAELQNAYTNFNLGILDDF